MKLTAVHGNEEKHGRRLGRLTMGRARRTCPVMLLVCALAACAACSSGSLLERRRATVEECDHIFDRLVAVELAERGLHDPVLAERRTQVLRQKLEGERPACVGRPLGVGAITCIDRAVNAEEIVHGCLK